MFVAKISLMMGDIFNISPINPEILPSCPAGNLRLLISLISAGKNSFLLVSRVKKPKQKQNYKKPAVTKTNKELRETQTLLICCS